MGKVKLDKTGSFHASDCPCVLCTVANSVKANEPKPAPPVRDFKSILQGMKL